MTRIQAVLGVNDYVIEKQIEDSNMIFNTWIIQLWLSIKGDFLNSR